MARLLTLPGDIQSFVAELARFKPTPSATALRARLEECPWIRPMIDEFPYMSPGLVLLRAKSIGLLDCRKCNSCAIGRVHLVRRRFDPELAGWSDEEDDVD